MGLGAGLGSVTAIASFAIAGDGPNAKKNTARQIAAYYSDREGTVIVGVGLGLIGCALIVFFSAYLSSVLRETYCPGSHSQAV